MTLVYCFVCVCVYVNISFNFSNINSQEWNCWVIWQGHLNFLRKWRSVAAPFCMPISIARGSSCSTSLPAGGSVSAFNFSHLVRVNWYLACFICIPLFDILIFSLVKCSSHMPYFLNWVVCFLTKFWEFILCSGYKSFIGCLIYSISYQSVALSSFSSQGLWQSQVLNFD